VIATVAGQGIICGPRHGQFRRARAGAFSPKLRVFKRDVVDLITSGAE
jgi:hypothetical protein